MSNTETPTDTNPFAWAKEYSQDYQCHRPPMSPDTSEALLRDPHLRAVYDLAVAVSHQQEAASMLAAGIVDAVAGRPPRMAELLEGDGEDGVDPDGALTWLGYALGCQMVWAVGIMRPDPVESVPGLRPPDEDETVEAWLAGWRAALAKKAAEATHG